MVDMIPLRKDAAQEKRRKKLRRAARACGASVLEMMETGLPVPRPTTTARRRRQCRAARERARLQALNGAVTEASAPPDAADAQRPESQELKMMSE